jgi:hypothetical protein
MKQPETMDDILGDWIGDLESSGTVAKWKNERLGKEAKRWMRKSKRQIREEKAIFETLEELGANRPVRTA